MKILWTVGETWQIVYETLQTRTRMINWRCWSSPIRLRMRVKKNLKISLLLFSVVTVLHGAGFSLSLSSESPNDSQLALLCQGDEGSSISSECGVSTKGAGELQINTPHNLGDFANLQVGEEYNCVVKLECWAGANTEKEVKYLVAKANPKSKWM